MFIIYTMNANVIYCNKHFNNDVMSEHAHIKCTCTTHLHLCGVDHRQVA
jgi:hypothetical protein